MFRELMAIPNDIADNNVAFANMSIRESKWRQITKISLKKTSELAFKVCLFTLIFLNFYLRNNEAIVTLNYVN
jgi:hypothetical protein